MAGQYQRALELILRHTFEPRHQSYSLLALYQTTSLNAASTAFKQSDYRTAIERIRAAGHPPAGLGVDDFAAMRSARLSVFEALLREAAGDPKAALQAWREAAGTGHTAGDEGIFRAIAMAKTGAATEAESWFKNFLSANEHDKQSNRIETRAQAYYLAGVYEAFRGRRNLAQDNFRQSLMNNRSSLWTQQAMTWFEAGLLDYLAR
jgi:hypothetical protein